MVLHRAPSVSRLPTRCVRSKLAPTARDLRCTIAGDQSTAPTPMIRLSRLRRTAREPITALSAPNAAENPQFSISLSDAPMRKTRASPFDRGHAHHLPTIRTLHYLRQCQPSAGAIDAVFHDRRLLARRGWRLCEKMARPQPERPLRPEVRPARGADQQRRTRRAGMCRNPYERYIVWNGKIRQDGPGPRRAVSRILIASWRWSATLDAITSACPMQ